jgi:hypothetical protein
MLIGRRFSVGRLLEIDKQKELTKDFLEENQDPIDTFYEIKLAEASGNVENLCRWLDGKTTEEVFQDYRKWCESINYKPEAPKSFTRRFSAKLPHYMKRKVLSLSGVKFNCYVLEGVIPKKISEMTKEE